MPPPRGLDGAAAGLLNEGRRDPAASGSAPRREFVPTLYKGENAYLTTQGIRLGFAEAGHRTRIKVREVPGESTFSLADFDRYVEEHSVPEEDYPGGALDRMELAYYDPALLPYARATGAYARGGR
jgi:hypothetical protein